MVGGGGRGMQNGGVGVGEGREEGGYFETPAGSHGERKKLLVIAKDGT